MILIGSRAIKYWFPDFPREPKDTDYIVNEIPSKKEPKTEYLENPIILNYIIQFNRHDSVLENTLCPDELCTLKASHLCWNLNFEKHMFDLQFLLKKGCKINEELFWELYNYWNEYHGKNKRSDLKMSKDDFFNNAINYDEHEHDFIHTLINPKPIYTLVLKDGCEVELDEKKFNALSHKQKCDFVREEVMVMAHERYKKMGYRHAYSRMLKKFIISHAPLFSILFILKNYIELHKAPFDFLKKIDEGLGVQK